MRSPSPRDRSGEPRVAATPDTMKKMKALGADVSVETGAGVKSGVLDADYAAMGATIASSAAETVKDADIVLKVRRPTAGELADYKRARSSSRSWIRTATRPPLDAMARCRRHRLRDGVDAAHHARAGHGRAFLAGEPRRLSRRDGRRGRIRPRLPMMMTAAGTVPAPPRCS